ncbi:MAG TPA: CBS domain-containing protein [Accumulibacter sp.]|uniref:CBS domain-containing protein n=2 Tax=Candidatus Accumulibacter TaxID=327159 RepID=A0A7D5N8S2_9PROT|nr:MULTISPECIES: CBS domain-containing protein [Candidatus Accumulibacter]QLH49255.1 MAG: CBS domain-containing protein [Candidatus Accumulibacter cognatus]MBL8401004.1 CBS domain-containing protein [Accumulibacter sp.]MBN8517009.1 CBS domain-containing protein [Accumulibacter sp.]MBO3709783.1 CBS domain-containing protein [Accumulibacter sp.]MCM8578174.1 CBS domain-containing protein [Accumulibacter sp.]
MPDTRFKPLPWTRLKRGVPCYLPRMAKTAAPVDANSPALRVMTDFQQMTPITIARDASLDDANRIMALCHVHYLLVADGQRQLQGIVTEAGTKGHRPLAVAHTLGVRPGELVVGDVMIKQHDDVEVMHLRDVHTARVGNVVATLKELGTPYCLVVDHDEEDNHILCGIFSLSKIEREMGLAQSTEIAQTFSQVVSSLGH